MSKKTTKKQVAAVSPVTKTKAITKAPGAKKTKSAVGGVADKTRTPMAPKTRKGPAHVVKVSTPKVIAKAAPTKKPVAVKRAPAKVTPGATPPPVARAPRATATNAGLPSETFEVPVAHYGTREQARRDAADFNEPDVFRRRSAMFPSPNSYGVTAEVIGHGITETEQVRNKPQLNRILLSLTIRVTGKDATRVNGWADTVKERLATMLGAR